MATVSAIRKILEENIGALGFEFGSYIRGKGLEIFYPEHYVFTKHRNTSPYFFDDYSIKYEIEKYVKEEAEKFFLNITTSKERHETHSIANIDTICFSDVKSLTLRKKREKVGYINTGKYDMSLDSQLELVNDLYSLVGDVKTKVETCQYEGFGENYVLADTRTSNSFYSDLGYDYYVFHEKGALVDENSAEYFEGRMSNYNHLVDEDFWLFEQDGFKEYFSELDPYSTVSVYARKGKDWYIAPICQEHEAEIAYKDEDEEDIDYAYTKVLVDYSNKKTIEDIVEYLASVKKDLEIRSFLRNELDKSHDYREDIFPIGLLEKYAEANGEDIHWIVSEIYDFVDDKSQDSVAGIVQAAFEKFIMANMKDEVIFSKYTHLKLLRKYAEPNNEKVVFSKIGDFTEDFSYAIKRGKEEFHFSLSELLMANPKTFYEDTHKKLSKRLLERYERSILHVKAQKVFVGLEDSYESGNCKHGTKRFCEKNHIDISKIGAIRGDILLELEYSSFTRRAALQAIKRSSLLAQEVASA